MVIYKELVVQREILDVQIVEVQVKEWDSVLVQIYCIMEDVGLMVEDIVGCCCCGSLFVKGSVVLLKYCDLKMGIMWFGCGCMLVWFVGK